MKKIFKDLEKLKQTKYGSSILFFGIYVLFFIILFLTLKIGGNKNYLNKEYEKGNSAVFNNNGVLGNNYYFDYKINLDGVIYDYYGKRYKDTSQFKFNNYDYYYDGDNFFTNSGTWVKCENPYKFYEFVSSKYIDDIMNNSYYLSKTEYDNNKVDYNFLISTNTINKIIYNKNTDYDEVANNIILSTDKNHEVNKITFKLDSFCKLSNLCKNSLVIELNYEAFNEVKEIDNPIS